MMKIRVVKAQPFDGCSPIDIKSVYPKEDFAYTETFLLIDGQIGNCTYWKKVEIAKEALVKGVIIINDDPEKNAGRPADYTSGLFLSFLIRPKDANILMLLNSSEFDAKLSIIQTTESL